MIFSFLLLNCGEIENKALSRDEILRICLDQKNKASSPETVANISKSKNGTQIGVKLSFSANYIKGINPDIVYSDCLDRLSK